MAMAKDNEKTKRIQLVLNLDNKVDKEVYNILAKKGNMSWYIKQAVLYFKKGSRLDLQTAEDLRNVITETIQETLGSLTFPVATEQPVSALQPQKEVEEKVPEREQKPDEIKEEKSQKDTIDDDVMDAMEMMF